MKFQKISLKQQKALEFQGLSYSVRKKIRTPDLLIRIALSSLFLSQLIKPLPGVHQTGRGRKIGFLLV